MLEIARNIVSEADIETRPRLWLYAALVMMILKIVVTLLLRLLEMNHRLPTLGYDTAWALFWISKILPITLVAALVVWSKQIRSDRLFPVFVIFLVAVIPFEICVVYSMLHGWRVDYKRAESALARH